MAGAGLHRPSLRSVCDPHGVVVVWHRSLPPLLLELLSGFTQGFVHRPASPAWGNNSDHTPNVSDRAWTSMAEEHDNAPIDFDLTGDDGDVRTSALSADTPVQQEAPSPRLREHIRPEDTRRKAPATDPRTDSDSHQMAPAAIARSRRLRMASSLLAAAAEGMRFRPPDRQLATSPLMASRATTATLPVACCVAWR